MKGNVMAQSVGKSQEAPRERIVTRGKKTYKFLIRQVFAEYDDRGIGNYLKIVEIGKPGEDMVLTDPEGANHHYTADEVADKLMLSEWGNSTDAEFQKRKENIERIEYDEFRKEQNRPSPIGTATVTIRADISDFEAKMDRAIAKLNEFIALSEKAAQYK